MLQCDRVRREALGYFAKNNRVYKLFDFLQTFIMIVLAI